MHSFVEVWRPMKFKCLDKMIYIRYCVVEKKWTACIVATIHIMVAMAFLHNLQYLNIHITELIIVSKQHKIYLIND